MTDQLDFTQEERKLPGGLNVLTILTLIWSAYELFQSFRNFARSNADALKEFDKAQEKMQEAPAWVKNMAGPQMREMLVQSMDNKMPLMIISLVAVGLCIFGAIEMRKLKRQGYFIWLIGEVLPFISLAIFTPAFYGTFVKYFMIFPVVFILLYSMFLKDMKR